MLIVSSADFCILHQNSRGMRGCRVAGCDECRQRTQIGRFEGFFQLADSTTQVLGTGTSARRPRPITRIHACRFWIPCRRGLGSSRKHTCSPGHRSRPDHPHLILQLRARVRRRHSCLCLVSTSSTERLVSGVTISVCSMIARQETYASKMGCCMPTVSSAWITHNLRQLSSIEPCLGMTADLHSSVMGVEMIDMVATLQY